LRGKTAGIRPFAARASRRLFWHDPQAGKAGFSGTMNGLITIEDVKNRFVTVRGEVSLLGGDVAALYGVEPREISQAVKNNPLKFPDGYAVDLNKEEVDALKSKILTLETASGRGHYSKRGYRAFTEKGLYMLATILKGERAVRTTIKIVETYAQLRAMVRDMEALQSLKDGSPEQARQLTAAGHKLAELIGENLSTDSTETTIEQNLAVLKITHKFTRKKNSRNRGQ